MKQIRNRNIIALKEYEPAKISSQVISNELAEIFWRSYDDKVRVDFPSPKTDNMLQLTSQGWVGHIPLTDEIGLELQPKVELENLFRMLEYAYKLKSFDFIDGLIACDSLEDFYERLANVLSLRILNRSRKGFYRSYLSETESLPFVRGRLDLRKAIQTPWDVQLQCKYEENTADVEENQILSWTLFKIARSGMCTERVLPTVRRAYRSLKGFASLKSFYPKDCIKRIYNRLNNDYHPLHALCRFFLERSGPSHQIGDKTFLPFLVNMNHLYELFVAEWLKMHLSPNLTLSIQEKVEIGKDNDLSFKIDLVLNDTLSGSTLCVIDTKYKAFGKPAPHDIAQVIAYAEMKSCKKALLVYPISLHKNLDEKIGNITVKSMTFSLDGNLEEAGHAFMTDLLKTVSHPLYQ